LGILLSDSSFYKKDIIRVAVSNNFVLEFIKNSLKLDDVTIEFGGYSPNRVKFYNIRFSNMSNSELKTIFRKFGLFGKKDEEIFIPEYIKNNKSEEFKIDFLSGLFDGDGCLISSSPKSSKGMIKFYTYSRQFYKDLEHMIQSLGGKTIKNYSVGNWEINIYLPFTISVYDVNTDMKKMIETEIIK
jgi:intein/homing endonuclease